MNNNIRKPYRPVVKEREHNINEDIKHQTVRIVGDGIESRVVSIREALSISKEKGVDLVEISPSAVPPVCKVMEYGKFLYDKKIKEKENRRHQDKVETKELRLTPNIDGHDFDFKTKHALHWLTEGNKVKAVVIFKGRGIKYNEQGEILLLKLAQALESVGKVDQLPKLEGFKMSMMVSPKKQK